MGDARDDAAWQDRVDLEREAKALIDYVRGHVHTSSRPLDAVISHRELLEVANKVEAAIGTRPRQVVEPTMVDLAGYEPTPIPRDGYVEAKNDAGDTFRGAAGTAAELGFSPSDPWGEMGDLYFHERGKDAVAVSREGNVRVELPMETLKRESLIRERIVGERDRARDLAARLEEENARLTASRDELKARLVDQWVAEGFKLARDLLTEVEA